MPFIDEMQNLREDIESGKNIRSGRIKELKEGLSAFMKGTTRKREEDFKVLKGEVDEFVTGLKKEVKEIQKGAKETQKENQAKQRELRKMLADAQAAFWGKKSRASTKKEETHEN